LREVAANRALTFSKDRRRVTLRAADGRRVPARNECLARSQDPNVHQSPRDHYPVAATRKIVQRLVGNRECREENRETPGDCCSALGKHLCNPQPNSAVSELHQIRRHYHTLANHLC